MPPSLLLRLFTIASPYNRCKGSIYLVFDFCEHDLAGLLSNVLVRSSHYLRSKRSIECYMTSTTIHRNKVGALVGRGESRAWAGLCAHRRGGHG